MAENSARMIAIMMVQAAATVRLNTMVHGGTKTTHTPT